MRYLDVESDIDPREEIGHIVGFLDRYWDVDVRPGTSLAKAVGYVLGEGIRTGIANQESRTERLIYGYNNLVSGTNDQEINLDPIDFERRTDGDSELSWDSESTRRNLETRWNISAKPKNYERFKREHDPNDMPNFDLGYGGIDVHPRFIPSTHRFQYFLESQVVYHYEDGSSITPLETMIEAIFCQGEYIGIHAVEKRWGTENDIYQKMNQIYRQRAGIDD